MTRHAKTLVEIGAHHGLEFVHAILEEVVRLRDDGVLDGDALLGLQFLDQPHNLFQWRDPVLVAMDEQAGRGARGEGSRGWSFWPLLPAAGVLALALLYGLATPAWSYVTTFFSEPLIALC